MTRLRDGFGVTIMCISSRLFVVRGLHLAFGLMLFGVLIASGALGQTGGDVEHVLQEGGEAFDRGDFPTASAWFAAGLARATDSGDLSWRSAFSNSLGLVYSKLGQFQRALEYHQQALAINREINDDSSEGQTLGNIGGVYYYLGQYQRAVEYFEQALAIFRYIGERSSESRILGNIGLAYENLGQYQRALEYHMQALAIDREINDDISEAEHLGNIGVVYWSLGQFQRALEYHQQALAIHREIGERSGEGVHLHNIGIAFRNLHQYQQALQHFEQSLAIDREEGDRSGEGENLANIGMVYRNLGQYPRALEYYEHALAIDRELGDRRGESEDLANIGTLRTVRGEQEAAMAALQDALTIQTELGVPAELWRIWGSLADLFAAQSDPSAAIIAGKRAVNAVQAMRGRIQDLKQQFQTSFLTNKTDIYEDLAQRLIDQGRQPEADLVLNMLKEEAFYDDIRRRTEIPHKTRILCLGHEWPWCQAYDEAAAALRRAAAEALDATRKGAETPTSPQPTPDAAADPLQTELQSARATFHATIDSLVAEFGQPLEAVAEGAGKSTEMFKSASGVESSVSTRAAALWRAGAQAAALALLDGAIAESPDDTRLLWARAEVLGHLDRVPAAIADVRRLTELTPKDGDAWGLLGWYLLLEESFEDARMATDKALELEPAAYARVVYHHLDLLSGEDEAVRRRYDHVVAPISGEAELRAGPLPLSDLIDLALERGWGFVMGWGEHLWFIEAYAASRAAASAGDGPHGQPSPPQAQPLAPLIRGDWRPLERTEMLQLLREVERPDDKGLDASARTQTEPTRAQPSGRTLALSFYPGARLIELDRAGDEGRSGLITLVAFQDKRVILDGTYQVIDRLNQDVPIALETAEQTGDYIRFYCAAIHGELGPMRLIEQPEDIPWRPDARDSHRARFGAYASPVELTRGIRAGRIQGMALYGGTLFEAEFEIQGEWNLWGGSNGRVDMSTQRVARNLAVAYEHFDGDGPVMRKRDDRTDAFGRAKHLTRVVRERVKGTEGDPFSFFGMSTPEARITHLDVSMMLVNHSSWQARNLHEDGRYDEAERYYREALAISKAAAPEGHPAIAKDLNNLALVLNDAGRYAEAKALYREALELDRAMLPESRLEFATHLGNLAALLKTTGRYDEAEPLFREALEIDKATLPAGHPSIATSLNNLAVLLSTTGRYAEAESLQREALAFHEAALSEDGNLPSAVNNLATLLHTMGRYDRAEPLYRKVVEIEKVTLREGHPDIATSLNNLAGLLHTTGRYAEAEALYREALAIRKAALREGHPDIASNLNGLSSLLYTTGRYAEAESLLREALAINKGALPEGHPDVALNLNNLAVLLDTTGRDDEAEPLLREALAMRKAAFPEGHPEIAESLNCLSGLLRTTERYEAESLTRQSLSMIEAKFGDRHPKLASTLVSLGRILDKTERPAEAEALYRRALRIALDAGEPHLLWFVQGALSIHFTELGRRPLAIFFGKQAVNTIQSVRQGLSRPAQPDEKEIQLAFVTSKEDYYRDLADLLIAEGRFPEASQVMRMLKEQEYYEFIRRDAAADSRTPLDYDPFEAEQLEAYARESEALVRIAAEQRVLLDADTELTPRQEARLTEIEGKLDAAYARFDATLDAIKDAFANLTEERREELRKHHIFMAGSQDERPLLDGLNAAVAGSRRVALLHTLVLEERTHLLLTLPDGVVLARHKPVREAEINAAVWRLRQTLKAPRLDPRPAAQVLYRYLIGPIAADLEHARIDTLLVSLDGTLRYVPLAALHDGERYLVERYTLPVFTEVKREQLLLAAADDWRGIGLGVSRGHEGVGPEGISFIPLPGVADELEGIIRREREEDLDGVLPGRYYLDDEFTASRLRRSLRVPVVHIASHFRLRPGNESMSYLLLGDGSTLALHQLRKDNYNFGPVDLVTLSACDTGVGGDGVEVEGLGNVVQEKGAKGVIATLWPVADCSTAAFMQHLYRARIEQHLTKADALRAAQLAFLFGHAEERPCVDRGLLVDLNPSVDHAGGSRALSYLPDPAAPYAHPYYWAPFILMGNWL